MKVVTIGSAMRDIFIQYTCKEILRLQTVAKIQSFIILEEGKKIEVNNLAYHTGGGATNSAVSFKRLGFEVESFFKIGTDYEGDFILEQLAVESVSTKHIVRTNSIGTGSSFITPCPSGNRTVLVYRGANLTLTKAELPGNAIATCDHLYITSLSRETSQLLPFITQKAKKHNKHIAVNPGTSQLTAHIETLYQSLTHIDILIVNYHEAILLMNALIQPEKIPKKNKIVGKKLPLLLQEKTAIIAPCIYLPQFFKEVLNRGPHTAVVTNGADGVYVANKNKIYFHPSIAPEILVSTLGAGDAFGSCFVAQLAQGKPIEYAIRSGIINSVSVLEHLDAKSGLLRENELKIKLQKVNTALLQTFLRE